MGGITLATCAYFQACDIKDKAHVIFVVDALNAPHTVLSINQILQALGRCREGVLSATLFFRPKISNSYEVMNRDELMRPIRDLVHVNLGYARIMFLDLCRQAEKPSQAQIMNILDGLRTSVFRRKMLKFNTEEYRIEVN